MIIGGLQSQLWSRNHFQSSLPNDLDLLIPKSIEQILDSSGASVWSFMIIGGLQSQLWSRNHFQSSMTLTFAPKMNRAHPWLIGIIGILQSVMVRKPFSITYAPWPWPFDPKINRAHPWLVGSKSMKFHYHKWITESVMVRETIFNHNAPWPCHLTFWHKNE